MLFRSHGWAIREQTLPSYELSARVMPQFRGNVDSTLSSREWCSENRAGIVAVRHREAALRGSSATPGDPVTHERGIVFNCIETAALLCV